MEETKYYWRAHTLCRQIKSWTKRMLSEGCKQKIQLKFSNIGFYFFLTFCSLKMIFFVLFFRFIKIGSTLCFYLWNWVIWPDWLLSNPLGWWWWCCRRCCCFLSAFFCFFCSTIFKHICLFLSLSACISRVPFFSLFIFSFQLESKEDKINQKHRTNLIAHTSHFVEYYVLLSIFGTISLQFVHLILVSYHYTHNVYSTYISCIFFLFVWKVLCACFLLTTTDTKFMNTIEMYFVFFLSLLNWRGKKSGVVEHDIPLRSKWAKWITH